MERNTSLLRDAKEFIEEGRMGDSTEVRNHLEQILSAINGFFAETPLLLEELKKELGGKEETLDDITRLFTKDQNGNEVLISYSSDSLYRFAQFAINPSDEVNGYWVSALKTGVKPPVLLIKPQGSTDTILVHDFAKSFGDPRVGEVLYQTAKFYDQRMSYGLNRKTRGKIIPLPGSHSFPGELASAKVAI